MAAKRDASSPVPWPPIIDGSALLAAGVLSRFAAWHYLPDAGRTPGWYAGLLLIGVGACFVALAGLRFWRAGTPIPPHQPTKALVFDGIYNFTRNPMYLGITLFLVGLGLAFDQLWFLIVTPFTLFGVTKLAIEREEAYLERKFGAPYVAYKQRVRRWI